MIVRRLTWLKREIDAQEVAINHQRRVVAAKYDDLGADYRRRLSSPSALVSSFSTGVIVGTWMQRSRRARDTGEVSRREHPSPLASVARTLASSALLHLVRKGVGLIDSD
ncbi:MAG: hypothetical protein H0V62_12890 [Gammaproteobacteria bacterium]|nr:hypothetical protein [Gammaproteobacteria bacterium]MBA3731076.1 hypothetical protein [Gammaproteobacteria bacterium]